MIIAEEELRFKNTYKKNSLPKNTRENGQTKGRFTLAST